MRLAEARSRASRSHRSYVNRERFRSWSFTSLCWFISDALHLNTSCLLAWIFLSTTHVWIVLEYSGTPWRYDWVFETWILQYIFWCTFDFSSGEHLRLTDALCVLKRLIRLDMSLDWPSYFPFSHLCSTMTWTRMNMLRAELVDQLEKIKPLKKSYLGVGRE